MISSAQVDLLKRMIAADREYWLRLAQGDHMISNDDRGVEVGSINSVNPKTANALVAAGLGEIVDLGSAHASRPNIFLGSYNVNQSLRDGV